MIKYSQQSMKVFWQASNNPWQQVLCTCLGTEQRMTLVTVSTTQQHLLLMERKHLHKWCLLRLRFPNWMLESSGHQKENSTVGVFLLVGMEYYSGPGTIHMCQQVTVMEQTVLWYLVSNASFLCKCLWASLSFSPKEQQFKHRSKQSIILELPHTQILTLLVRLLSKFLISQQLRQWEIQQLWITVW